MLHIHFSNRFEILREQLLARLGAGRGGVFTADVVLVPNAAIRRHLSLALADAHGICAQVHFDFLAAWLWQQVRQGLSTHHEDGDPQQASGLASQRLVWRIHSVFSDADFVAEHPRLAHSLRNADDVMRFELAGSVAALFEQYQSYRADWLQAWLEGRPQPDRVASPSTGAGLPPTALADEAWQVALWRRLMATDSADAHPLAAFDAALALVQASRNRAGAALPAPVAGQRALPRQLHVMGLPTMPPLQMQLLQALASTQSLQVHVYVLNPCQEHWFELIDRKRLSHLARLGRAQGFEVGNRLLAAWGRQTQAHVDSLVDSAGPDALDDAVFMPHPGCSLLAQVHNAILHLTEMTPGSVALAPDDRSIELHVCHSLTRELEVLHDHLLGLFAATETDAGPALLPSQVLVVLPDLVAAAPLIDAVFGTAPQARRVAYTVSGRPRSVVNAPARAALALLALAGSRCTANDVFAALQLGPVARRFGLDDGRLMQVHEWLQTSGFHWALDAPHRATFDVPPDGRHTLLQALERLFLGYASPDAATPGSTAPLELTNADGEIVDLLPCGDAEGTQAPALGALWQFVQRLQSLHQATSSPHTPLAWAGLLQQLLLDFVQADGDELADLRELRQVINTLAEDQHSAAPEQRLPLAVVLAALRGALDDPARGGVPTGQVTFSSMSSLRGLPFEVVCVIGLNDGAFPTAAPALEFDLMTQAPRRGDRQRRLDERNLFLDLLLAARRSLYLSHSGRSVLDNAPLPPSVLVSELLEVLLPAIATDPASAASLASARERLVVEHPLQPFALATFELSSPLRLRSFNRELCEALQGSLRAAPLVLGDAVERLAGDFEASLQPSFQQSFQQSFPDPDEEQPVAEPLPPFFTHPLAPPGPAWRDVSLAQLVAFFRNPCRTLLRDRLHLQLPREAAVLQDDEPFLPDWAARQALQERLLPALLAGAALDSVARLARAGPEQPGGWLGEQQLQAECGLLESFAQTLKARLAEPVVPDHAVELTFDIHGEDWSLQASLAHLRAAGQHGWRADNTSPGDYLQAWLTHLVLCAAPAPGVAARSFWLSRNGGFGFDSVPAGTAFALLHELLLLYRQGLCQPLHFFIKSAWAFVRSDHNLAKAAAVWRSSAAQRFSEGGDPAYELAFRGQPEPLDAAFEALSAGVLGPLLQYLEDPRVRR